MTTAALVIRRAAPGDIDTLVAFTLREAAEAEGLELDPAVVRRGVAAAFGEAPKATYWVAEAGDRVVGSISVLTEWSNFRAGEYWWVQSLFVDPAERGAGVVERLMARVSAEARAAGALDLRLYVHENNPRATRAYRRLGFTEAKYRVMILTSPASDAGREAGRPGGGVHALAGEPETAESGIAALYAAWEAAFRRRDLEAIVALLTPDYELTTPGAPRMTLETLRPRLAAALETYDVTPSFEREERVVFGDLAFERGWDLQQARPRAGGDERVQRQRVALILRRGLDGRWRFARGAHLPER